MKIPHKHNPMVRMLKRAARARREHGIALLFTLCILSMALITAMIFSATASTGRKVASAYVDSSAARILADGVVNRAILALMESENAASYVCSNYGTNAPTGKKENNVYAYDWIWKLEKKGVFSFDDGPLRFNKSTYYDLTDSRCPSWEYVISKDGYGTGSQNRIIGRYAYVAIGQNDQLNPNAIGKRNYPEFDLMTFQKRLGRWTCEPQFNFKSQANNWNYENKINPTEINKKYIARSNENWPDVDVFLAELTEGSSAQDKQLKMMAEQYFDVSEQGEYNKFRTDGKVADLTTFGLESSGEHYRFPLIRNDWEVIDVATVKRDIPWFNITGTYQYYADQSVANLINYNASVNRPPVTDKDNWLGDEPSYTGNKRTPYINEVRADVTVGGNLGLRRQERYLDNSTDPPSWKWRVWFADCTFSHEISLDIETVNMYPSSGRDAALPVGNPIPVGEISYEYFVPNSSLTNPSFSHYSQVGTWVPETVRIDVNTPWQVNSYPGNNGYTIYTLSLNNFSVGSMTTPRRDGYESPMGHESDFQHYVRVRNVRLKLDRVLLRDAAGRNADLALMPTNLSTENSNNYFLTSTDGEQVSGDGRYFTFDTQVNDPRANLRRMDWGNATFATKESMLGTIGSVNDSLTYPSGSTDYEKRKDPAYAGNDSISTAYIRHGQMQSLWELGAIHRGGAWQTINLKCAGAKERQMDSYAKGDGHLLDQVALTRSTSRVGDYVIGMINLNCVATFGAGRSPFTFKSLFTNFPLFRSFAAMNDGRPDGGFIRGSHVDSDNGGDLDADAYAKDLSEAVTYAIANGHYLRRTAVFPTKYPSSGQMEKIIPANVPDAQAEEVFCRVVNLLKWNKEQIRRATVLVLAQTIKDVGGANLEKVLPKNDEELLLDAGFQSYSSDKRTSTDRNMASNIRTNYEKRAVAFQQYDDFYDEITGEAKVIVRLEWDESANNNTGAWIITRKEYVE